MRILDVDKSGDLDTDEVDASSIDLDPIHKLEMAVKAAHAKKTKHPLKFIPDSEAMLARRQVERDLIEGVKERNGADLKAALAKIESNPDLGVAPELLPPAKKMVKLLRLTHTAPPSPPLPSAHSTAQPATSITVYSPN